VFLLGGHGSNGHGYTGLLVVQVLAILLTPCIFGMVEEKMGLELEWVFNTSAQFPGLSFGAGHQGCITVWDIDNDGVNEVLWGTRRGDSKRLWCIEGDGSFQWIYPPMSEDGLLGDPTSKVSLVDVDNNGVYELLLGGRGGRLHVLNSDGSVMWVWDEPNTANIHGAPQGLDVDGDGFIEVFIVTSGGFVHRISHDGDLVWTSPQAHAGGHWSPTVCDLEQDGRYEVIWNPYHGKVYCLNADTGNLKWIFETKANPPLIVTDVNRDDLYEIVVWTDAPESAVIIISHYGTELARWTHPREGVNMRICQAMGDVDEDGSVELALMSGDTAFLLDIGVEKPFTEWEINFTQWSMDGILPIGAQANHWTSYQLIADIDGDDQQEILWLSPYPIVTDARTGILEGYYVNEHIARNRRQENGGWWGDVDQDGVSEWVMELNGNSHPQTMLYCLTMNGAFPARAYWPEYVHSAYPAQYQAEQNWLLLKSASSNSLWFPITDSYHIMMILLLSLAIAIKGGCVLGLKRNNHIFVGILALGILLLVQSAVALEEKMGLELEWAFNNSAQFPGLSFGAGHQGPPTVWDIDGDSVKEVLWGTRRGDSKRLWCIGTWPTPKLEWIYPPLGEDGLPGDPTSKVSLIDVDNDGVYELALAGRGGRLHIIEPDGSVKWTWDEPTNQTMHGAPQAHDVDGDGLVEFFLNTNNGYIHRVDVQSNGLVWVWSSLQAGSGNPGQVTVCDLDQDGSYEIVWASQDCNVYCYDAFYGIEEWRFDTGSDMQTNQVIVADTDGDGEYEVLAWNSAPSSSVIVISYLGQELRRWRHPREGVNLRTCQAMGDVDEDGSMEMAIMSGDAVFVIDVGAETPFTQWEANLTEWSVRGIIPEGAQSDHWTSYQLIADIDGDDRQEILWLAPFPIVTDGATGSVEGYYVNEYIARNRRQESGGWWGDVDNDGFSEWVCELNGNSHPETQLYCLTMGGKFPAQAYWPEYYHCAYPAKYQAQQDWLLLKGAYSNSLWFPIPQTLLYSLFLLGLTLLPTLLRAREIAIHPDISYPYRSCPGPSSLSSPLGNKTKRRTRIVGSLVVFLNGIGLIV